MDDKTHLDVQSGYDRWAEVYDDELNPLVLLEDRVVRKWTDIPAGARVADVGCGTGRHTIRLAEAGARVDAFDSSPGMLTKIREKLPGGEVQIHQHTLPTPLPAADATYDLALLALVADHLADLEGTFRELRRVIRPGGTVIFTVLHPAMNLRGITARFTDPASGGEVRVAAFEHTYADYVMGVLRAGLAIDEIIELKADEALAARAPRARKYVGWPMLLAMRLRRCRDQSVRGD